MKDYNPKVTKLFGIDAKRNLNVHHSFQKWEDRMLAHLGYDENQRDKYYFGEPDRTILKRAREHIANNRTPITADRVLVLTHPLYLTLSHPSELDTDQLVSEAQTYLDTLFKVLKVCDENPKIQVMVLDSLHYYGITAHLLESSLVDDVAITHYHDGSLVREKDLKVLGDRNLFLGGGYDKMCLSGTTIELWDYVHHPNIKAIRELCLRSPQDSDTLVIREKMKIESQKIISLEEFLAEIGEEILPMDPISLATVISAHPNLKDLERVFL